MINEGRSYPAETAALCGYLHHADASTVTLLVIALSLREVVHSNCVAHSLCSEPQLKVHFHAG